MTYLYKLITTIIVLLMVFASGAYWGRGHTDTKSTTTVDNSKTQIEYRDRIVTVTKTVKPDGTVTETTKTEQVATDTNKQSTDITQTKETKSEQAKYALMVGITNPLKLDLARTTREYIQNYYLGAGVRVLGPAWIEAAYTPNTNEVSLGLRLEF